MKKKFRDTEAWKYIRTFFQVCLIALAIFAIVSLWDALMATAGAEELNTGYVICQPGDFVNIRSHPSSRSDVVGMFDVGDQVTLDGKKKNGYLHAVCLGLETDEGWICEGYVVYDKPEYVGGSATIVSNGRLAARKNVNGKRTRWLKNGASLKVYYVSDEWCVTNCGYVQTQYLELEEE